MSEITGMWAISHKKTPYDTPRILLVIRVYYKCK